MILVCVSFLFKAVLNNTAVSKKKKKCVSYSIRSPGPVKVSCTAFFHGFQHFMGK